MKINKIKSIGLLLLFFTGLAFADGSVSSGTTTMGEDGTESTYIVDGDITVDSRMTVYGTVTLHLNEGAVLNAHEGITVPNTATLIIEADGEGETEGKLIAGQWYDDSYYLKINTSGAGIGGCTGSSWCGTVIINGGNITATGYSQGAGIGGGSDKSNNSNGCNCIKINGGTITAKGGSGGGAGIGGGELSGIAYFEMNGGKVTAKGGNGDAAGIGGGDGTYWAGAYGSVGTIVIKGGEIYAESTGYASAIGAGNGCDGAGCTKIEITGGKITAISKYGNALGADTKSSTDEIIIKMTNPGDYLDMSGSKYGFKTFSLTIDSIFRLTDTGTNGRTLTYIDKNNIVENGNGRNISISPYLHYTVTYLNQNYYLGIDGREQVFYGAKLEQPADPVKEGFTFGGWFKNRTFSTEWDFDNDLITGDLTLYGKLVANKIRISTDYSFDYTESEISVSPLVTSDDSSLILQEGSDYDYTLTYEYNDNTVTSIKEKGKYTVTANGTGDYYGKSSTATFYVIKNPSGSGSQDDPYRISSSDDWSLLADNLSYGYSYSGKYISLENNIVIDAPLGSETYPFDGIFTGNNNLILTSSASIFEKIKNATISDFYTNLSAESAVADTLGVCSVSGIKTLYTTEKPEGLYQVINLNENDYYIADMEISGLKSVYVLTDGKVEIKPVITISGITLALNTDYTISFVNKNTGAGLQEITDYGEYTATLTGCGNYTGTYSFNFNVVKSISNECLIEGYDGEYYINMPSDSSLLTFDATGYDKGFTFKIYDNGGKGGSYFNNALGNFTSGDGYLKITVPEGYLIHFSGYVATKSKYDYLTLYDGADNTAATLYEKTHGENDENQYKTILSDVFTSSNTALLYFKGTIFSCEGLDITATIVNTKKIKAKKDEFTSGIYYTTFYTEEENFIADTNTRVFYATEKEDGKINLTEDTDRIIKAGQGVILQSTASEINLYATNANADYTSLLTGTVSEIESAEDSISGDVYIIGNSPKGGIGFYKWTGKIEANKAYLLIGD